MSDAQRTPRRDRSPQSPRDELERLRAQLAELRVGSQGLELLLDRFPLTLWTVDADFRLTSWRGSALKDLDVEPAALMGVTMYDYWGTQDPDFPPIAAHHRAIMGEAASFEAEIAGVLGDCHVEPLYDEEGEIVGVLGVALERSQARAADEAPIRMCASCKSVCARPGRWEPLERFLGDRVKLRFSHGLCPSCVREGDQS